MNLYLKTHFSSFMGRIFFLFLAVFFLPVGFPTQAAPFNGGGEWVSIAAKNTINVKISEFEIIEIVTKTGNKSFQIEIAKDEESRNRGLMFRTFMPADQGMLFDFGQTQMVAMWMKNTHLSLDMLFILSDGRIHRIEAETEPFSERTISSGVPVRAVLELNAGTAAAYGIQPGDRLLHPLFSR